ncbi:MAG: hypothetical protein ACK4QW_18595, partial [Alphaproteobacteria bacterium]
MWLLLAAFAFMGPLQASEMVRDREGRLIGQNRDRSDRILGQPVPGPVPVPGERRGSTLRYTLMTLSEVHQQARVGEMVNLQGYMSRHALHLPEQSSPAALIFETRVVQEPFLVLKLSVLGRFERKYVLDQCNTVCRF